MGKNTEQSITITRIMELMGNDSQETFAEKIKTTQSNVSKMLKGTQQPSAATLKAIAQVYDVSVDWLLGLSNSKTTAYQLDTSRLTYADAISVLVELYKRGSIINGYDESGENIDPSFIKVRDEALLYMLRCRLMLTSTNEEMRKYWLDTTVKNFSKTEVLQWADNIRDEFVCKIPNDISDTDVTGIVDRIRTRAICPIDDQKRPRKYVNSLSKDQ